MDAQNARASFDRFTTRIARMKETHVLPAYVVVRAAQHIYDADAKRFPGRERIRKHIENEVCRGHGANKTKTVHPSRRAYARCDTSRSTHRDASHSRAHRIYITSYSKRYHGIIFLTLSSTSGACARSTRTEPLSSTVRWETCQRLFASVAFYRATMLSSISCSDTASLRRNAPHRSRR